MLGFSKSKCDPSLFILSDSTVTIYMLVYVDDIILTSNSPSLLQKLIDQLHKHFSLKDLGTVDYFLGIEVKFLSQGRLFLSQDKYITDLLTRVKMDDSRGISTPMVGGQQLAKEGTLFDDPTLYRSVVGALQYATITRPEIAFSVIK
uniref:Reverse transcriptase Ty1/copia-type domain-containing protein n=1 Tax=Cajanus cajan TaxID=3821 RepID=A0A151R7N6_CAJCA|nr:hypothetical protein KK1_040368 [Cajanus cajan]